jgi:hypothetical protein
MTEEMLQEAFRNALNNIEIQTAGMTLNECVEKQIPKKQGNIDDYDSHLRLSKAGFVCCSATNKEIRYPLISFSDLDYCPRCGQKLDWSEV